MSIATSQLISKTASISAKMEIPNLFWPEANEVDLNSLPTMYDLPSENKTEEPALDEFHDLQAHFLTECYRLEDYPQDQIFTAADMYLYYDPEHPTWYKRADWFAVVGVPRLYKGRGMRSSYVVWDEGVPPYIVVELLSPSTMNEDLGRTPEVVGKPPPKWKVYEQLLKIPYYLLFDRRTDQLQAFKLVNNKYERLTIAENRLWIPELKVGIGLWPGAYQGIRRHWLRWYDKNGDWLSTPVELAEFRAEQERQAKEQAEFQAEQERQAKEQAEFRAEQERQAKEQAEFQAEQERQAKEKLAAKLRELGIDPTAIA
ncbi:Uma2 family endonuclease [Anaerolineales bacterium HSG24]|nr:Uma2 family endonuclease [Anaerolineales bacterium HSG24]